jgi:uncharacterized protein YjdB
MKTLLSSSLFLLTIFFAVSFVSQAQQYTLQSSSTVFTPLAGGAPVNEIENDQGVSAAIPLGFDFTYFGVVHTSVQATAEGFLTFNNIPGATLPFVDNQINSSTYLNIIAPLWDDHEGVGGAASHSVSGFAPNRVFTFEWLNWRWNYQAAAANISFQVKLYETSNVIEFIYRQEPGALTGPTASTGLVGPGVSQFYSLSSLSGSPDFSGGGVNTISSKPVTGQIYTFTPSATPVLAPTTQAQTVGTSQLGAQTCTLTWANGNGSNHAVFMKQTSAIENVPVFDNTAYSSSSSFAAFSSFVGSGWYCVYNGNGTSASVSNLQSGVAYRVQVLSYNGLAGQQKYLTTTNATNPVNITTALQAPQSPYSTLSTKLVTSTSVTFDLAEQSGAKRVIFAKQGSGGTVSPVPNTTYTASLTFGSGSQIGTSGWFCVFNGTTSSDMTLTGLQGNTGYLLYVVDYNGPAGSEIYASPVGSGILANVTTYESHAVPVYSFQPSAGSFVPLVGGTAVNTIENDDALSSFIPLGFTFRMGSLPFTQVTASSNGFLSFNPYVQNVGSGLSSDLSQGNHRPLVAPLWDDLSGADGQASYLTEGTEPNRIFTFEWLNWRWNYSASSAISFQVKLYESNNRIEYIYRQEPGALSGPSAAIGLSFASTGAGNFISLNNSGAAPTASLTSETSSIATKPATGQVYSFTPAKMNQSISFTAIADKFFGGFSFNVSASATSGIPVTLVSSNPSVATVSGLTVTLTGAGSVTITASQAGNDAYNPAIDVQRAFIVNKGNQTISFNPLNSKLFSEGTFNLTATATSTLPVTYESSNTSVATVSGSTVTFTGVGTADITATQDGNGNYNPAQNVVRTLTVNKGNQIISITPFAAKTFGDGPFEIVATTNSNLPLTFMSSNPSVATVSGSTITIVGAGSATITASQSGNALYNSGSGQAGLYIAKASQTIDFPIPTNKTVGDEPFTLSATASSGLPVTFSINTTVGDQFIEVQVTGNIFTIVNPGSVTIDAWQDGNANYLSVPPVQRSFCILPPKPVITVVNTDGGAAELHTEPVLGTFLWIKNGVEIVSGGFVLYNVTEPGTYTVVVNREGCESLPSDPISLIITGTDETADAGINIFPNPVMNELVIDITSLQEKAPIQVELIDLSGRILHAEMVSEKTVFKMNKHEAGSYVLRINGSKRVVTKQIIKN